MAAISRVHVEIRNTNHHIWRRHARLRPNRYPPPSPFPGRLPSHSLIPIGSGKTAAFLIPVLSKLFGKALKLKAPRPKPGLEWGYQAQPLILVLGPTRELVWQIFDEARKFCYRSMLRPWYPVPDQMELTIVLCTAEPNGFLNVPSCRGGAMFSSPHLDDSLMQ